MTDKITNKKAHAALLIYTLLGVIAIGVCFIVDFATNEGLTWALYVLYAVPVLFLGMIPLCFHVKYNLVLSAAVLSITSIPLLFLLDSVTEKSDWFSPLGFPIAVRFLAGIWISGILLKIIPVKNKWYLSGILLFSFGTFMILSTVKIIEEHTGGELSQLISIIGVFSFAVSGAILASAGCFRKLFKGRKSNT